MMDFNNPEAFISSKTARIIKFGIILITFLEKKTFYARLKIAIIVAIKLIEKNLIFSHQVAAKFLCHIKVLEFSMLIFPVFMCPPWQPCAWFDFRL